MQLLAAVLDKFVGREDSWAARGTYAVFLDFVSLCQKDTHGERTDSERVLFTRALDALPELYSHPCTWLVKVTRMPPGYPDGFSFPLGAPANTAGYYERGWCFCESSMGNLVKNSSRVLDLAAFSGTKEGLVGLIRECRTGRPPPLTPAAFANLLEGKSFTSKKADLATVGDDLPPFQLLSLTLSSESRSHLSPS